MDKLKGDKIMNDQLVLDMYKNNISIKKIACILKCNTKDIYETLRKYDIFFSKDRNIERDSDVCSYYLQGRKITEIANILKINRHTVTDILKNNGIYKGNRHADNLSNEKKERNEKILSLYESGLSLRQVANRMDVCPSTVLNVLKTFKRNSRPQHSLGHSKGTTKNRKYHFILDFFENIDSEAKAYFLGFLMADGNVSDRGEIKITLSEKDISLLEVFKEAIDGDMPIKKHLVSLKNRKYKCATLLLSSVKMAEDLMKKGCIPRKTFKLNFPNKDVVPEEYIHHFMRGYFDGDGCMCINGQFSVIGCYDFIKVYEEKLLSKISKRKKTSKLYPTRNNSKIYSVSHGGRIIVKEIHDFLYKNATIFLERKRNNFYNIIN